MKKIIRFIVCIIALVAFTSLTACNSPSETGGDTGGDAVKERVIPKDKAEYPVYERKAKPAQIKEEIEDFDFSSKTCVKWLGRNRVGEFYGENAVELLNVASGFSVSFKGTSLSVRIYSAAGALGTFGGYIRVYFGGETKRVPLSKNGEYYDLTVASGLNADEIHTVKVLKAVEEDFSRVYISGITTDGAFYTPDEQSELLIDFYGDSITAGFGVLGNGGEQVISTEYCDGTLTYAAKIAEYLSADYNVMAKHGISLSSACDSNSVGFYMKDAYKNYSVYCDEEWDYSAYQPDVIVINLGTNDYNSLIDATTGKFNPNYSTALKLKTFISEYTEFILNLHEKCPKAKILCCLGMMGGASLYAKISGMVDTLIAEGKDYVYGVELYTGKLGGYGHPSVESNEVNAEIILELMSAELGINKIYG